MSIEIKMFTFNVFSENTYVIYNDAKECIIIDPGCSNEKERYELTTFIQAKKLVPKYLINTHCHVDHVFGNDFCAEKWNLKIHAHENEKILLDNAEKIGEMYGIDISAKRAIDVYLTENDTIAIQGLQLQILLCPGHSPGSLAFYSAEHGFVIVGDVLFYGSIGRTDFPNCNHQHLLDSIKNKLYKLPPETKVYSGHGPATSIGFERENNPFVRAGV